MYLPLLAVALLAAEARRPCAAQCGVQHGPNDVLAEQLAWVNFDTNPLFYGVPVGPTSAFTALAPYVGNIITNNTIAADSSLPGLLRSVATYAVPAGGALQATATFSFEAYLQAGAAASPLGFAQDPYYGAATFGFWQFADTATTGWQLAFLVTNEKVYALYAYSVAGTNVFRYVIPVANRTPEQVATYSVTVGADYFVSYRIDGLEVLRISPPDRPIDTRFETGREDAPAPFTWPTTLQLVLGNYYLLPVATVDGGFNFVCQRTLFRQCQQSLANAFGSDCQYAALGDYLARPSLYLASTYEQFGVVSYLQQAACALAPGCCARAVTCPDVRPLRPHRHRRASVRPAVVPVVRPTSLPPLPAGGCCGCGA